MTVDLSAYRIVPSEKPASAAKQNNMLTALENALNALPASQIVGYPVDGMKYLNGAGNWVVPPAPPGSALIYAKTTSTLISNSTAKTDLFGGAFTIAGNAIGTSGAVKMLAGGYLTNSTGANQTVVLELKLGATVLWAATSEVLATAPYSHAWFLSGLIQALGSTSSQIASGTITFGPGSNTGTAGIGYPGDPAFAASRMLYSPFLGAASAVDMANPQTLTFSATLSVASASFQMGCNLGRLEAMQ